MKTARREMVGRRSRARASERAKGWGRVNPQRHLLHVAVMSYVRAKLLRAGLISGFWEGGGGRGQLMKIFAMVGTATDRGLLSRMACAAHFAKWPVFPRKLEATVRPADPDQRLGSATRIGDSDRRLRRST